MLSRRLSRALKLLETATLALVSLAESTLELPRRRPHLLARVLRADGGPDEGEGDGVGEGAAAVVRMRESSVRVNLAGNFLNVLSQTNTSNARMRAAGKEVARESSKRKIKQKQKPTKKMWRLQCGKRIEKTTCFGGVTVKHVKIDKMSNKQFFC